MTHHSRGTRDEHHAAPFELVEKQRELARRRSKPAEQKD